MTAARRRRSRKSSRGRRWLLWIAAALALSIAYLLIRSVGLPEKPEIQSSSPPVAEPQGEAVVPGPGSEAEELPPEPEAVGPVRVALVIDDLGRSLRDLERLEALGIAISYSVLPFEVLTQEVVAALREREREYLCHLPMEPANDANPGPGALTISMAPEEMELAMSRALDAVSGAVGVNNHMGSGLTVHAEAMALVGGMLASRDLFFLDSRTTADSVAYEVIRGLGVPSAERHVFLDPDLGDEAIRDQFRRLVEVARKQGAAIGIGHPHPVTFAILEEEVPAALAAGVEFTPVSYLLERSTGPS